MKIAVICDTHFGIRSDVSYILDYQEKFYKDIFFPYLKKHKINTVFHLGDLFDRRKYINFVSLQRTKDMFLDKIGNKYDKDKFEFYILAGNHDVYHKSSNEINSLRLLLQDYDNTTIVDETPYLYKKDDAGNKILFIPWINSENYETILKEIHNTDANILCGHLELAGFDMHKGVLNEHGMSADIFKKFDLVLSGHFHTKSQKENIHYLGSPMEFTFSDCGDDKGFHILDTETKTLEFIKNPYTLHEKIYYYDDTKELQDKFRNYDFSKLENKIVKLFVCKKTKSGIFENFIDNLVKVNVINLSIMEDYSEFDGENVDIETVASLSTKDLIDQYIDFIDTDLNKDRLKKILNNVYVESLHTEV